MRVLIADKFEQAGIDGLKSIGCQIINEPGAGASGMGAAITTHDPQVLIVRSSKVPGTALSGAKSLKLIVRAGSGVDNIEVPAASAKHIAVCNCAGMNAIAVAELALGLLLACDRRIPDQCASLRSGQWNKKEFSKSRGLAGLTLCVAGVGAIGREVISRALAFRMKVVGWSDHLSEREAASLGIEFGGQDAASLMKLAGRIDAISAHVPLNDSTKKLFGKAFFDAMKPGSYFINTSRGGVVDEAALRDAVQTKGIRAGLDVYEGQPAETSVAWECASAKVQGIYTTHHCGASTDQAQNAVAEEAVRIVHAWMKEGRARNCVNAQAAGVSCC